MIFHDVEQSSPEWDELRLGLATASNAGSWMANYGKAFGDPADKYALRIALERITGRKSEQGYKNEAMERGHAQEPIARMIYEEENFIEVSNGGFFHCGDYGDSPDGLISSDGVLEIKSVEAHVHYANVKRGTFDPSYKWQLVSHIDCTERDWVDFASYCADYPEGNQLYVYRITRESVSEELKMLQERRAQFIELVNQKYNEIRSKAA